ncbi:hypothetical protein BJX65DRAFT_306490 [Aspergillus insuetus]
MKPVGFTADEYRAALWTANLQLRDEHLNSCPQKNAELAQPPRKKAKRGKKARLQLVEYDYGVFRDRKGHMVNIGRGFHFVHQKYLFLIDPAKMPFHIDPGPDAPVFDTSAADKELKVIVGTVPDLCPPHFKGMTVCLLS